MRPTPSLSRVGFSFNTREACSRHRPHPGRRTTRISCGLLLQILSLFNTVMLLFKSTSVASFGGGRHVVAILVVIVTIDKIDGVNRIIPLVSIQYTRKPLLLFDLRIYIYIYIPHSHFRSFFSKKKCIVLRGNPTAPVLLRVARTRPLRISYIVYIVYRTHPPRFFFFFLNEILTRE